MHLGKRLKHPRQALQEQGQRLDMLEIRLHKAVQFMLALKKSNLENYTAVLRLNSPRLHLQQQQQTLDNLSRRLHRSMDQFISHKKHVLQNTVQRLNTLSPLTTLARGYSITTQANDKFSVVSRYTDVKTGDTLRTQLHQGVIYSTVISTQADPLFSTEDELK